jgi:hypothetical protein
MTRHESFQSPEVLAMIICDLVITDAETNKKSLIGLFDRIETTVLPCPVRELHVYLSLTDGHGTLPISLTCVASESPDVLFRGQVLVSFRDPLQVIELDFVFPNVCFPARGEYRFQLCAGRELLRERKFHVSDVDADEGCC